jgi:hypothetical protein
MIYPFTLFQPVRVYFIKRIPLYPYDEGGRSLGKTQEAREYQPGEQDESHKIAG